MIVAYIQEAMKNARYEKIDDAKPYYAEVQGLDGVWANGQTLEECRRELAEAIEDWLLFSIAKGLPIPPMGKVELHLPSEVSV